MIIQCSRTFCPPNTWVFPTYDPADNVFVAPDDWDFDFEDYTVDIAHDMRPYTFIKTPEEHVYRVKACRAFTELATTEITPERIATHCTLELTPAAWLWREFAYSGVMLESSRIFPTSGVSGCVAGIEQRRVNVGTGFDIIVTVQGEGFIKTVAVHGVTEYVTRGGGTAASPDIVTDTYPTPIDRAYASQGRGLSFGKIYQNNAGATTDPYQPIIFNKIVAAYIVPALDMTFYPDAMCIYGSEDVKTGDNVARWAVAEISDYQQISTSYTKDARLPCLIGAALEAHEYSPGQHTLIWRVSVFGRVQITVTIDGDTRDVSDYFSLALPVKGDAYWWSQNGLSTNISLWGSMVGAGVSIGSGNILGGIMSTGQIIANVEKLNEPKGLSVSPGGSGMLNALAGFVRFDEIAYNGISIDAAGAFSTNGQIFACGELIVNLADRGRAYPEYFRGKFSPVTPGVAVVDRAVCEELAGGVWIKWR